jgi:uncharacterized membrane protein YfcA
MELTILVVILLVTGAVAGTAAGLFGVGGGLIIVPLLAFLFEARAIAPGAVMHLAIGTSLATIVVTSISSARAHHRRGAIEWRSFRQLTPGVIVGALLGAAVADTLRSDTLRFGFAIFVFLVALQMAWNRTPAPHRQLPGRGGLAVAGTVIGAISSLVGIGGGTMTVPFLAWCNVALPRAVGTSAAVGLPIAVSGTVGFVVAGWNEPGLPAGSLGYVYLPAFFAITVTSTVFAVVGARLAHRLSPTVLRRVFALFLFAVGIRMLF